MASRWGHSFVKKLLQTISLVALFSLIAPASDKAQQPDGVYKAMPLTLGLLGPFVTPPTIYVGGNSSSTSASSTHTYSSLDIGSAPTSGNRVVIACFGAGGSSRTVSSVTIGGVSATVVYGYGNVAADWNGNRNSALAYVTLNTGTTATVAVTWSGSISACGCQIFSISGVNSTTPVASGSSTATATTVSVTATTNQYGHSVMAGMHSNSTSSSFGATGTTSHQVTRSTVQSFAAGYRSQGSSTNSSETLTESGGASNTRSIAYVHFR